jgi:hypothetical protein
MYDKYIAVNIKEEEEWTGDIPNLIPKTGVNTVFVSAVQSKRNVLMAVLCVPIAMILSYQGIIALLRRKNEKVLR